MHQHQQTKQSGFSIIEASLITLIIAALAVTGLVVYQHHKSSSGKNSAATSTNQTTSQPKNTTTTQPAQTTAATLDIKEWGVHMTLDSSTSSLYYYINPQNPNVAFLSLKKISDISPDCAADKGSLGAIVRLTPAEQQIAPNADFSIPGTVQIGNYWFGFSRPQGTCISPAEDAAVQNALPGFSFAGTLSKAFNTLAADSVTN